MSESRGPRALGNHGQSTIEFALTISLLIPFVLFFLQLCLVFGFGNYVHYATFMSARAFLAASESNGDQEQRAKDVIIMMLKRSAGQAGVDKFPSLAHGQGGGGEVPGFEVVVPPKDDPKLSWQEGVRYTFRSRIFMIPLARSFQSGPSNNTIDLTSESFLLREPSYEECQGEMRSRNNGIFDNGC